MTKKGIIIVIAILVVILIIQQAIIVFRKPVVEVSGQEKILLDSIKTLDKNLEMSRIRERRIQSQYDSLQAIEPHIITNTRDKVKFIYSTATPDELDSIIRTAWKTKSRYR